MTELRKQFEDLPVIEGARVKGVVYGFGIKDSVSSLSGKQAKEYKHWKGILRRCYSPSRSGISDNYLNCSVSDEFKYFSKFKAWCLEQAGFGVDGWEIDKDLLVKGNLVYGPDTCCFPPREINSVLITQKRGRGSLPIGVYLNKRTGAYMGRVNVNCKMKNLGTTKTIIEAFQLYKNEKEKIIKDLAKKYRGLISDQAYLALMNYKVSITD